MRRQRVSNNSSNRLHGDRVRFLRSVFEVSALDDVADAVAVATRYERRVYVERVDGGYRWSLTHEGGPYPLLRSAARFLGVDYRNLVVSVGCVSPGISILRRDPEEPVRCDRWAVVEFDGPTLPAAARKKIVDALNASARTTKIHDRP